MVIAAASPQVTQWPARLVLTAVFLAVVALAVWGMWIGWRNRGRRQADLAPRPQTPAALGPVIAACEGRYVGTVRDGDWLDRIVAQGLGDPGRAGVSVHPEGLLLERDGAAEIFIPVASVESVGTGRGVAGEVAERDGLTVVRWHLGELVLATAFRADRPAEQARVTAAIAGLVPAGGTP